MKQALKNLGALIFMMMLFTSSQEKATVCVEKCMAAPVVQKRSIKVQEAENQDNFVPLSPISRFILLQ